jgi:hypothetical protein
MSNGVLRGGCLCGLVTYEVKAPTSKFAYCHCSRCRKATGTAFASNIYVEPPQLMWKSGSDAIERYNHSAAASFAKWFCRTCGSPLPRVTRSGRTVVIPAGSLDQSPIDRPKAHIFWESRASWVSIEDSLPRYAEYPEWW